MSMTKIQEELLGALIGLARSVDGRGEAAKGESQEFSSGDSNGHRPDKATHEILLGGICAANPEKELREEEGKSWSVRVEAEALNEGLNFTAIGNAMLRALHLHKEVEAVRIIFVTDPKVDYGRLQDGLKKTKQITATIDHMLKDVNMDCGSCGLQEICDEIEGLREMHFGMSEEHT